jgi:hypothetical protein
VDPLKQAYKQTGKNLQSACTSKQGGGKGGVGHFPAEAQLGGCLNTIVPGDGIAEVLFNYREENLSNGYN